MNAQKERPIGFDQTMVRAILQGYKTQTRRPIKRVSGVGPVADFRGTGGLLKKFDCIDHTDLLTRCPYGQPGDRLWVKENSRITLEITDVRVELLQSISEADARAEGVTDGGCLNCGNNEPCQCNAPLPSARDGFIGLWETLYGRDSWLEDPYVWVIKFKRVEQSK